MRPFHKSHHSQFNYTDEDVSALFRGLVSFTQEALTKTHLM